MSISRMGDYLELITLKIQDLICFQGKTVGRAKREHRMVDIALYNILLEEIIGSTDIDSDSTKQLLQGPIKGNS